MARLIAVTCPKCGAEVDLDPGKELVKCTYCGTSSFVSKEERHDAEDLDAQDEAWEREQEARRAETERQERDRRAEAEREEQARLLVLRREDELRLRAAVQEEKARERSRRILIWVLAALPIGAFLALYLTK